MADRRRWIEKLLPGLMTAVLLCVPHVVGRPAAVRSTAPPDLLRAVGFSSGDIGAVERGEPVARLLDTDRREVAVIGAVRIDAPRERLAESLRTIDSLRASRTVLDVGRFSTPPGPDDLVSLQFEPYDLDVRDCRPGDCRVRLSEEDIARFQREVDWRSPAWQTQSARIWRRVLGGYADAYFRKGQAGLPVFANKTEPLSVADETRLLLGRSSFVSGIAPGISARAQQPMAVQPDAHNQLLYWSKEDFGIRPVMRVTHRTIYQPPSSAGRPRPPLVISGTQLYASHYLDAAVSFIIAVESPSPARAPGFYMISVTRARTRSLTGILRTMVRSTVRGRSRDAMEKVLRTTKSSLERSDFETR
jgi:hypothetical protein